MTARSLLTLTLAPSRRVADTTLQSGFRGKSEIVGGIGLLRNTTDKPIVFVAQSFGGREVYTREPSAQEERIMVCESPISCAHSGCERACPERS